jgi:hypothetical protein
LLLATRTTHLPYDGESRVDTKPNGELNAMLTLQTGVEGCDGVDDAKTCKDSPPGVVFMRLRIAEIHQEPVAEILRNMTFKALDNLVTAGLIGANHLPEGFGIELSG